jgi:lipoate-protein ligase A
MGDSWRLLVDPAPATGWWNMAVDEALLAAATRGAAPVLRLYGWRGAWLSLGYAQPFDAASASALRDADVQVLRRVTGGRAVLHGADLTYGVAAPAAALPAGLDSSYRLLSDAILAALRELGVAAERAPSAAKVAPAGAFDCFALPATDEICAGDRKLAGSAQRRVAGAVLQHGSIRLEADPPAAAAAVGLGRFATSLQELGVPADAAREGLVRELPAALGRLLGVGFENTELDPAARRSAEAQARILERDPLGRRTAGTLPPQEHRPEAR